MHAVCRGWVSKQDENALQVKMEMPGITVEHVKMWAYPKGLLIKGEGDAAAQAQHPALYTGRIGLSLDAFEVDQA
jgi:HSP20 family protein